MGYPKLRSPLTVFVAINLWLTSVVGGMRYLNAWGSCWLVFSHRSWPNILCSESLVAYVGSRRQQCEVSLLVKRNRALIFQLASCGGVAWGIGGCASPLPGLLSRLRPQRFCRQKGDMFVLTLHCFASMRCQAQVLHLPENTRECPSYCRRQERRFARLFWGTIQYFPSSYLAP